MDIKAWLRRAGEPVAELCFPPGDAPALPYIVYLDAIDRGGSDTRNILTTHSLTIERYSDIADDNTELEALLDSKALEYSKERTWLPDPDNMYQTTYDIKTKILEREAI